MKQKFNDFFELFRALADGKIVQFYDSISMRYIRLTKDGVEQSNTIQNQSPINWCGPTSDIFDFAGDYEVFVAPKQSQENQCPAGTYAWMVCENRLGFDTWRRSAPGAVYMGNSEYFTRPTHEEAVALDWESSRLSAVDDDDDEFEYDEDNDGYDYEEPGCWSSATDYLSDEVDEEDNYDCAKDTHSVCPSRTKVAVKKKKSTAKKSVKKKASKRKPAKKKTTTKKHDLKAFAAWGQKLQEGLKKKR